jgi:DNA-binding transcriptional LysR family regulator
MAKSKIIYDNMEHQENLSMTLRQLRYAVAAADAGRVTQAAVNLNVSQPSISVAIAQIEAHYGRKLFVREKGEGVRLTSFGVSFIREARAILADAARLHRLGQGAEPPAGEVKFGCFTDLAPYYVPAIISQFQKAMPTVTVDFREAGFDELAEQIGKGVIDLALTYDLGLGPGIERQALVELNPHALLGANHPLARQQRISLAQLANYPLIVTNQALSWQHTVGLFTAAGLDVEVLARASSFELQRSMVANGLGVAVSYTRPKSDRSYDGRKLAIRPVYDNLPAQRILLVWDKGQQPIPAASALRSFIANRFADSAGRKLASSSGR